MAKNLQQYRKKFLIHLPYATGTYLSLIRIIVYLPFRY